MAQKDALHFDSNIHFSLASMLEGFFKIIVLGTSGIEANLGAISESYQQDKSKWEDECSDCVSF